ncbi:hypothetical protein ACIQNU_41575 [Streptomyces sp. NPDC091292]|uniref:hypothetical protein n=1 Tax=Streptomyces sp. NPDC091292 TaxID=3365991 RepID=UPI003821ED2E
MHRVFEDDDRGLAVVVDGEAVEEVLPVDQVAEPFQADTGGRGDGGVRVVRRRRSGSS